MTENELKRCREWFSTAILPTIGYVSPRGEVGYSEEAIQWAFQAGYAHQSALLAKAVEALEKCRDKTGDIQIVNITEQALAEINKGD